MFNGYMMTDDGTLLTTARDIWDFLARKGISDSDIRAIRKTLEDCDEYISLAAYEDKVKQSTIDEEYYQEQQEHLMHQITDTMTELDAINNHIRRIKRLNRESIIKDIQNVYDNLYHNT